jgi:SAM-dependent methyltransferase
VAFRLRILVLAAFAVLSDLLFAGVNIEKVVVFRNGNKIVYDATDRCARTLQVGDRDPGATFVLVRPLFPSDLTDFAALKGLVVVDSGCGNGQFVADLIEKYQVEKAYGYDIKGRPPLADKYPGHLFQADALQTGIPSDTVNVIFSTFSAMSYENGNFQFIRNVLLEAKRILVVGGEIRASGFNLSGIERIRHVLSTIDGMELSDTYIFQGKIDRDYPELRGMRIFPIYNIALRITRSR